MWKATAGIDIQNVEPAEDDDWETDPNFINDVSEEEQRWGSKTIAGSGRTAGAIDMDKLRHETEKADQEKKRKQLEEQNPGYGYGGKFGIQKDRMDKSAVGHDYIGKVEKHASQKDYSEGFGGKFGIQKDRVDKSAAGWDHKEKVEKHASQKDYSEGFGGKFGVQSDRVDKSAVGWDHVEKIEKHESQKDYSKGFGGKYGVQKDRMDKSAAGYDDNEKQKVGTTYTKVKPNIEGAKPSNLRAKFENLAKNTEEETRKRAEEQKRLREEKDRKDREEAAKKVIVENTPLPAAEEARITTSKGIRSGISTGREGGIGNAISAFNKMQSPTTEVPPVRKEPIIIPKASKVVEPEQSVNEEAKDVEVKILNVPAPPPDVIPSIEIQHVKTPPQEESPTEIITKTAVDTEPVYQNQEDIAQATITVATNNTVTPVDSNDIVPAPDEAIYSNSDNLADYIEDTGIKAIALYDYQAADDDEISFDPDDIVTHIEMIDEGWWRGLCKNRYGLFPANYVQLLTQQ